MQKGSGLADWETLAQQLSPILHEFIEQYGRPPKHRELRAAGHGKFVSACFHHHSGYTSVLRRLGTQPAKRIRAASPEKAFQRQRTKDHCISQQLQRHFPDLLRLGIAPSSAVVFQRDPRLCQSMFSSQGGYEQTCRRIGLISHTDGRRVLRQMTAILEAWIYVRTHNQWPRARACSNGLRHLRFQRAGQTWYQSFQLPLQIGRASCRERV